MLDLVIAGGMVLDGTGRPARRTDIGVEAGRIAALGDLSEAAADERLDATGMTVTPGFIDAHSHSDLVAIANPGFESTVRQGVTTEVVGNCGLSNAPLGDSDARSLAARLAGLGYAGDVRWRSFADHCTALEKVGLSVNIAWLVGHGAIRRAAGVNGSKVDATQRRAMRALLEEALDAGALGFSTGLEYDPGKRATVDELIDLAGLVGRRGRYYASHIRNRDEFLLPAVDEFVETVRRSGARGQLSHLNVRYDTCAPPGAWGEAVERMATARDSGLDVLADTTPFTFGIGLMMNILPPWLPDGPTRIAAVLENPDVRARVEQDIDRYWRFLAKGAWHRARPLNSREHPELNGISFAAIADDLGSAPIDVFLDLLRNAGEGMTDLWMLGDLFHEQHMVEMVSHPLFLLGADTMSSTMSGPMWNRMHHNPISFGAHVQFIKRYGLELRALPVEEVIRKMTGMVAQRFGLSDRGVLTRSAAADIVVLDLSRLDNEFAARGAATGVEHVFVNGVQVIDRGRHTGARPGRQLAA